MNPAYILCLTDAMLGHVMGIRALTLREKTGGAADMEVYPPVLEHQKD
jgi:hypothetical protein